MALSPTLPILKAAADPTRLRLLAVLDKAWATVGDLVAILDQSQPRVSRHLRILGEAGLVQRARDGQLTYYGPPPDTEIAALLAPFVARARDGDALLAADAAALARRKRDQEGDALAAMRARALPNIARPRPDAIAAALRDAFGNARLGRVLDVGAGAGQLISLLAGHADEVTGVEPERAMRLLSRARLHREGSSHCRIVDGDAAALPFARGAFDLVVLDEVLSGAREPRAVIAEAARVLAPGGRLAVLDRVLPASADAHRVRGPLRIDAVESLLGAAGFAAARVQFFAGRNPDYALVAAERAAALGTGTDG